MREVGLLSIALILMMSMNLYVYIRLWSRLVVHLDCVLSASSDCTSANANQHPRVDELRDSRPEAVLFGLIRLQLGELRLIIAQVSLFLARLVLPERR